MLGEDELLGFMKRGEVGRSRLGIDLVAGGRSKALVADRQAGMTHYIWRWRRTLPRETMLFPPTPPSGMPCVFGRNGELARER